MFDQNYTYNMFYTHLCRICYIEPKNTPHDCYIKTDITHVNNTYTGVLKNKNNTVKWKCEHHHPSAEQAITCANNHKQKHREGNCQCSYYAKPLPHWLKNQKTTQLYILHHPQLQAWKIGVTGKNSNERLTQHYEHGWRLKTLWKHLPGIQAYTIEQKVLEHWRKNNILPFLTKQQTPQGGWTETASVLQYSEKRMETLIQHISKETKPPDVHNR